MKPHGGEDEEELNEDGAEGEDAADQHAEDGLHVPCLGGDLAGDLVRADLKGFANTQTLASISQSFPKSSPWRRDYGCSKVYELWFDI